MNLFNFFNNNLESSKEKNKDNIQNKEISTYIKWKKIRNFLSVVLLFIGLFYVFMATAIYVMAEYRESINKYIDF